MSATLDSRTIENLPRRHSRTIENQRAPATIFFIVSGIQKVSGEALPTSIVPDNGPELTSKAMFFRAHKTKVKLCFIQPGKPTQNAYIESFNGRFRDGCLKQHWFISLNDARQIINDWRHHYNNVRPHSSPGYRAPTVFEAEAA